MLRKFHGTARKIEACPMAPREMGKYISASECEDCAFFRGFVPGEGVYCAYDSGEKEYRLTPREVCLIERMLENCRRGEIRKSILITESGLRIMLRSEQNMDPSYEHSILLAIEQTKDCSV